MVVFDLPKSRNEELFVSKGAVVGNYRAYKKKYEQEAYYKVKALNVRVKKPVLKFVFHFKDNKRRDLDNYIASLEVKGIIDGVARALNVDDCWRNIELAFSARVSPDNPRLELYIEEGAK